MKAREIDCAEFCYNVFRFLISCSRCQASGFLYTDFYARITGLIIREAHLSRNLRGACGATLLSRYSSEMLDWFLGDSGIEVHNRRSIPWPDP